MAPFLSDLPTVFVSRQTFYLHFYCLAVKTRMDSYRNRTCNVLVLDDSHVYWLEQFVSHDLLLFRYPQDANAIAIVYRGNRGGTVSSMRCDTVFRARRHGLPHAVIVILGVNDIDKCDVPPQRVGMEVYTLAVIWCVAVSTT